MILQGNAIEVLKTLPSESVDCIITSPPYYQLRKYGDSADEIGLEATPQEYIAHLMQVFDQCKRVLKADGTCFVNIADSYKHESTGKGDIKPSINSTAMDSGIVRSKYQDYPRKTLLAIPSRFEIAMIDGGWTLRNEIIWHKPNAMPSSVTDRFTIDFEKIFFFVKSRSYYFQPLREKNISGTKVGESMRKHSRTTATINKQDRVGRNDYTGFNACYEASEDGLRNKRAVWSINTQPSDIEHFAMFPEELVRNLINCGCRPDGVVMDPFAGAGTTLKVAKEMGFGQLGIELYEKNAEIIEKRLDNGGQLDIFGISEV